ncbi:aldo/keto reductase [Kitasatospora herbaricolor]|uniref:aldo/keto reductase n=1 Tax=Kitasatospora herbaricolor TaxID=68217 RepID=UPI0017489C46|nr:aldo/keto reductase [Kitasatospora herbaricolor]MDQ0309521.1 aryl-alcohol dehydrogenase-like predicted oxidoreductase [Kitasatospora herbaricolor]GGV01303.1 aldo/keto reductase [Kitasatospora herbaricolor]
MTPAPLPTRRLGPLRVAAQGLGCLSTTSFYGRADPAEAMATLHEAIDRGVALLDTAAIHGMGAGERLVGRAVAGRRDEVLIATKVGLDRAPDGTFLGVRGDREFVRRSCEASLERLGVERIDILYKHWAYPGEPIEESMGALAELVAEGKVAHIGLSEMSAETIRRAHAVHPVAVVQSEWSLWAREIEAEVVPVCRELGIGIVPCCPLGRGFLAGQVRSAADLDHEQDFRRGLPRFTGTNLGRNLAVVEALREPARRHGVTLAQLALAWLQNQGPDVVPIPGTAGRAHLRENLAAAGVELSAEELALIAEAAAPGSVHGDRYPPALMSLVGN